jgi:hypothetical protein
MSKFLNESANVVEQARHGRVQGAIAMDRNATLVSLGWRFDEGVVPPTHGHHAIQIVLTGEGNVGIQGK